MAARRPAYASLAACVKHNSGIVKAPPALRWVGLSWTGGDFIDEKDGASIPDSCAPLLADACRLCVCCEFCPCAATPAYAAFVCVAVAGGALLLAIVSNCAASAFDRLSRFRVQGEEGPSPTPTRTPTRREERDAAPAAGKGSPLSAFGNRECSVVRRAVRLWHSRGMISDAQRDALLETARDGPSASPGGRAVPALVILAFAVALSESATSGTVPHAFLSSFLWIPLSGGVPALGKALAMLALAAATEVHTGGGGLRWEAPRAFFFLAFVGSVALSAVDTGAHEGETSGGREDGAGSDLWYAMVGCLGTLGIVFLGYAAPRHFGNADKWAGITMMLLVCSGGTFHKWTHMSIMSVLLVAMSKLTSQIGVASKELATQLHETGIFFLVLSAAMTELCEHQWSLSGKVLGVTGTLILIYGAVCDGSTFQAALSTVAICIAASEAWWDHTPFVGVLNLSLRLLVAFILVTMAVGGWGLKPLVTLPQKSRTGVANALVGVTLILLLTVIVTGNSHHRKEWVSMMDFDSGYSLVDGGYEYRNRGIYILPWCIPLVMYYRMLYSLWPEQEVKFRRFHVLRIGVLLAFACHFLRLLSWSVLFFTLARVVMTLPSIENHIRGGPRS